MTVSASPRCEENESPKIRIFFFAAPGMGLK
jgi:hypothetical protein